MQVKVSKSDLEHKASCLQVVVFVEVIDIK